MHDIDHTVWHIENNNGKLRISLKSGASVSWLQIKQVAYAAAASYSPQYVDRLINHDIKEIEKQGAETFFVNLISDPKRYTTNKNGLLLPFLLSITTVDPIASNIIPNYEYQPDYPDIDIDFLPLARDHIKEHAAAIYGHDKVCSVGTWQTYKPKLAIQDAARALGQGVVEARELTKLLPDEFDEVGVDKALAEYPALVEFNTQFPDVVSMAYRMKDLHKTQGKHAGGLIISSVPVRDHIPLSMPSPADRELGRYSSVWTEGRSPQLSKLGFIKFDFLGVRTLSWCWDCAKRIKQNRGISITWDMIPEDNQAGTMVDANGVKHIIKFDDKKALTIADEGKWETVFQFETDLATSIADKGGVRSFKDLMIYTSLGRPGPLPMVDVYLARRDGKENWEATEDQRIIEILKDTYGVIVFQEDLAKMWMTLAGFTKPEAEAARKAVAKKWEDKLKPIAAKWIEGAKKTIGLTSAKEWWDKMVTFGRYAFNKSHITAYTVITYRCLWLKANFPTEWWAAVLSDVPHRDKLNKWMGTARKEGVKFGTLDVNMLAQDFTVKGDEILPGLSMIKGFGDTVAAIKFGKYTSIEDFINKHGSSKTLLERLIKLGAFDHLHKNRKALWAWWQYEYGSDAEHKALKRRINASLAWPMAEINKQRDLDSRQYFKDYPNRKKSPPAIMNWVPKTPWDGPVTLAVEAPDPKSAEYKLSAKIQAKLSDIERLFPNDYKLQHILRFEREYLGFYWNSPMGIFKTLGRTLQDVRDSDTTGFVECIIESLEYKPSKKGGEFAVLNANDGVEIGKVMIWGNELESISKEVLNKLLNKGVVVKVSWSDKFRSFTLARDSKITALKGNPDAFGD